MGDTYAADDTFVPFSNGTEYEMWLDVNCRRGEGGCRRYKPNASSSRHGCPIEVAIALGNASDGNVRCSTGLRGGLLEPAEGGRLRPVPPGAISRCPEYRGYDEPDGRPRRGPRAPEGQMDLLDPRTAPARDAVRT